MSAPGGKAKILVAEDDQQLLDVLKSLFRSLEHRVKTANGPEPLADTVTKEIPQVLVCDLPHWLALRAAVTLPEALPPTMVTADYAELEEAKLHIEDVPQAELLPKPVRAQQAIRLLDRLLQYQPVPTADVVPCKTSSAASEILPHFGLLIGEHPTMQAVYEDIAKVADTNLTVLIRGESGTGKDLVARAIHQASARSKGPFVAVNCTSVHDNLLESELFGHVKGAFTGATQHKDGLFKVAEGGTIFLDEIGSIPVSMQLSLLRVLQDKTYRPVGSVKTYEVDVRIVAATNENLEERIRQGLFREDLFFRLNAFPLQLPPLRERRSDLPLLTQAMLRDLSTNRDRPLTLHPTATAAMEAYDWPGNVRELQNIIQRLTATLPPEADVITAQDLKLPIQEGRHEDATGSSASDFATLKAYLKQCERDYLKRVYDACEHNKEKTAKVLGVSIGTFYRKLEE